MNTNAIVVSPNQGERDMSDTKYVVWSYENFNPDKDIYEEIVGEFENFGDGVSKLKKLHKKNIIGRLYRMDKDYYDCDGHTFYHWEENKCDIDFYGMHFIDTSCFDNGEWDEEEVMKSRP